MYSTHMKAIFIYEEEAHDGIVSVTTSFTFVQQANTL